MYKTYFKRIFDFTLSVLGLFILSPIFALLMVIHFVVYKGKPFYIQERPGRDGKFFRIIKFRTMIDARKPCGASLPDVDRLTKLGIFARMSSLDELPQLINVVKGEMSLVGPRPLIAKELEVCNPEQLQRNTVKPGITGWAQINGRNTISCDKKFEYDVWYVKNLSFLLDVKILFKTIRKVAAFEGIEASVTPKELEREWV